MQNALNVTFSITHEHAKKLNILHYNTRLGKSAMIRSFIEYFSQHEDELLKFVEEKGDALNSEPKIIIKNKRIRKMDEYHYISIPKALIDTSVLSTKKNYNIIMKEVPKKEDKNNG